MDLIPQEYKYELMAIRERSKDDAWRIGDIANEIIEMVEAGGIAASRMEVYRQVARECGRPERTVRYYARVSAFFPMNKRREYDILSFEHFRVAAGLDNWEEILEDAVSGVESNGRPKTVEYLTKKYIYGDKDITAFEEYCGTDKNLFEQIEDSIDKLIDLIQFSDIPSEAKSRMNNAVVVLRNILKEIK